MLGPVASYAMIGTGLIMVLIISNRFPHQKGLIFLGFVVFVIGIIFFLRQREQSRVVIDRAQGQLHIFRKKPLKKKKTESYPLTELVDINIQYAEAKKGQRIIAEFKDGQKIPLTNRFAPGQPAAYPGLCKTLLAYIGKEK